MHKEQSCPFKSAAAAYLSVSHPQAHNLYLMAAELAGLFQVATPCKTNGDGKAT